MKRIVLIHKWTQKNRSSSDQLTGNPLILDSCQTIIDSLIPNSSPSELSKQTLHIFIAMHFSAKELSNILFEEELHPKWHHTYSDVHSSQHSHKGKKNPHHNNEKTLFNLHGPVYMIRAKRHGEVYIEQSGQHMNKACQDHLFCDSAAWLSTLMWLKMHKFMRMELTSFSGLISHMGQSGTNLTWTKDLVLNTDAR